MNEERKIEKIPISKIVPNIYQPRIVFNEKLISELSESIKNYGIIQPIVLRKLNDRYEIIDGERRYKAAKKAGLNEIPAIVLNLNDKEIAELILNENIQKQLLNPIEEANAYQQIMLLNKISLEELSKKVGKDSQLIENKLKLLELSPIVQEGLLNNKISETHARLLTKIKDRKSQNKLYERIITERITVKSLEDILKEEFSNDIKNNEEIRREKKIMNEQFSLYNDLMKEKEQEPMGNSQIPQAILNNVEQKQNDFFPSLEEQPLNMDFPSNNNQEYNIPPMENNVSPMPGTEQATPSIPQPVEMPSFNMPEPPVPPMENNIPQMPGMEQIAPSMPQPVEMPSFNMPEPPVPPMENSIPQMPGMEPMAPSMPQPVEMNIPEPQVTQNSNDINPAINIIKDMLPLLQKCGYNITLEEQDNNTEYHVTFKIQK